ncbi:LysR family transcriptional regulator [Ensifer sp. Root31]|uniref:LysR family transcriptional regulator n=1 Tax=unclassified Ensifer TaxID=2633371 RepID=UPI00070ECAEA|nr:MULTISPECIES: LysR family transcriptional regulator [unclassified Ensifer]KQU84889.1 LysR family transcriptional regulator [Ensifer sp. Root31]KQW55715.1 LysR family transcriptional regulator [Ensifer sp. Root127]
MLRLLREATGLIAFVRTVQAGSFSAAARSLGATPSSISKSISRLERLLGVHLFRRSTRLLAMTQEGEAFYDKIMPLLEQIDSSAETVQSYRAPAGHLRASLPSELGRMILEPIFTEFVPMYPEISLSVGMTDRHVDLLRENYDVAFRVGQVEQTGLMCKTLSHLDMTLVASPSFLRKHGDIESLGQLKNIPFARYVADGKPYPIGFVDGGSILPSGRIDLDSATAIRDAALSGVGAAHLIKRTVQDDIDRGLLIELLPHVKLQTVPFQAVHASGRLPSFRLQLFTDFVATLMRSSARE